MNSERANNGRFSGRLISSFPHLLISRVRGLELGGEVEAYFGEVLLGHSEDVAGVGEEYVATVAVESHVLVLAAFELSELGFVVALYPAGFVEADGLPAALGVVLVLKAILDDLELELAYGTDDLTAIELVDEELSHAFVHELGNTFLKLLGLHGVGVLYVFEHLG